MDRIALIAGDIFIYWSSILLTLGAGVAICVFLTVYRGRGTAAAVVVPLALVLSVILGRLAHWYFRPDSYESFLDAVTDFTSGGYALLGVFLACALAAVLVRLLGLETDLPRLLDEMSLAGCGGIAVGRLACFFSAADRGQILETIHSLPLAYPVNNVVTGAPEYRLATFVIQAMVTAVIFGGLLGFYLLGKRRKPGDAAALFLLLYGMSQAVLDSTRYDSLYMRSNGFISAVQLSGAAALLGVSVLFSVWMVKQRGFRFWYAAIWLGMLGCLVGAGYMEYFVQRHGDRALFSYSIMTACLGVMAALAIFEFARSRSMEGQSH